MASITACSAVLAFKAENRITSKALFDKKGTFSSRINFRAPFSRHNPYKARHFIRASVSEEVAVSDLDSNSDAQRLDVSSNCVNPVFRSVPKQQETSSKIVRVLFASEGNVCRSLYAEAVFNDLIESNSLQDYISCYSKATRDYNIGESVDPRAEEIAKELKLKLREDAKATMFEPAKDIVDFDIVIVMDKYNAVDVLKEVSVFDTIDSSAQFSAKVRRLGDFSKTRSVEDIDDPLYGNMGGSEELDLLRSVASDITESCKGLLEDLLLVKSSLQEGQTWKQGITQWLRQMNALDWLVPPMLQKKN